VVLTDNAVAYFEACTRLLDDMRDADETVAGEYRTPKGELTVTAPLGFGRCHLQPVATQFLHDHPEINLNLLLVDRVVNLVEEHVDLAIRILELPDSGLAARPIGTIKMVVCASPAYLQAHGTPTHPSELAQHRCIAWSSLGPFKSWLFSEQGVERMFPINVRMTTTTPESAVDVAVAGLGLTQITSYQAEAGVRTGALVPVLREFEANPVPVNLVHPSNRRVPLKLRTFIDYVAPRLTERLVEVAQVL
jgi:DNA-binding transcriptional LysR family regulator